MRILLHSHWFSPSIGGVETVSAILAEEFTHAGCAVTVLTNSEGPIQQSPYAVVRRPSFGQALRLARASDIVLQNTVSLRTFMPFLLSGKPIVVTHQSWMRRHDGTRGIENYLKLLVVRFCHNISISKAIADDVRAKSTVIGNPFETHSFKPLDKSARSKDIVYMGRLVSDKGCDVLLKALSLLQQRGYFPTLTIIGDGSEEPLLRQLAERLPQPDRVKFVGAVTSGRGLLVAQHRIMVIPSVWAEPFGIVALEGIASGCAIVASNEGGLPEAVGPCGLLFPNGDIEALSDSLERLLVSPDLQDSLASHRESHLKRFTANFVAQQYLTLFKSIM